MAGSHACADMACFEASIAALGDTMAGMSGAHDVLWVLLCTTLVFFMQAGFAMLEAGTVRTKNVSNILFKNAFDPILAGLMWWAMGYALAFGEKTTSQTVTTSDNVTTTNATITAPHGTTGFIGTGDFFLVSDGEAIADYHIFIFQWAFCATAATIVSGAIAERCYVTTYFIYSAVLCGFVYPVVVHWMWSSRGWLSPFHADPHGNATRLVSYGVIDFAGSGVVHMVGGVAALAGALITGPRAGWSEYQTAMAGATSPKERRELEACFAPHDRTCVTFGTLILWFGWFGFNCGSTVGLAGGLGSVAGKVGVCTALGAAGGAVASLATAMALDPDHRLLLDPTCNGILGGLVAVTASCAVTEPYAALVIGLVGGVVYVFAARGVAAAGIDDVLQASAVHGFCGAWGVIAVGFFANRSDITAAYGVSSDNALDAMAGVFYSGSGKQLGVQILAVVVIAAWTFAISAALFGGLRAVNWLRTPAWMEEVGIDRVEHGAAAFTRSFRYVAGGPVAAEDSTEPAAEE